MRKKAIHRDYNFIENVDFDRLNEILEGKGITKLELSRRCGYYDDYVSKHVFREKRLNQTVANTLEKVYGVSSDEYTYKRNRGKEKEKYGFYDAFLTALKVASFTDNELKERKYTLHVQVDGLQLKKMILEAVENENNFLNDCIFDVSEELTSNTQCLTSN